MRLLGLIVAASLLACASPAFATSGDCVWNNLTPQTRTALLEAYKTKAAAAFGSVRPNATDEENLKSKCGMTPANMMDVLGTLKMMTVEKGAAAALKAERGLTEERLDQAFKALAPADRDVIMTAARGAIEGDDDQGEADGAITRFMESLALPIEVEGVNQGFYWLRAHVMRLAYEAKPAA